MKSTVLTGLVFLLAGVTAYAQLSFLPQIGFEQSRTTLNYGDALSTSGVQGNLKASLKMDYRLKGGHSPFVSVGTSPAPMNFSFADNGSLLNSYQSVKNNLQFRLEAGYQYSSRPIQLKKGSPAKTNAATINSGATSQRTSCGSFYRSRCGAGRKLSPKIPQENTALNMRLQPSVAVAYIPSAGESIKQTGSGFEYNAANWKTAIVPAMGFEFAKGAQRLFTLSVFYTKPLGGNEETFTNLSAIKPVITRLDSKASTWGLTLGVPFSFTKSNTVKTKKVKRECTRSTYRRCSRI